MSVDIPEAAVVFGSVTPPQGDVIELRVHLGCTKEVSSFECLLQNWSKKYSPGETDAINVGMDGHIDIGRGSNVPQLIRCRVEGIKFEGAPTSHYLRVSGRCWGERLFRRVITKTYENKKGEGIIRDLVDNYIGLNSYRGNTVLTADAVAGQKNVFVANTGMFSSGDPVKIEDNNASEFNVIDYYTPSILIMVNDLTNTYTMAANGKVWKHTIEPTDTTYTKLEYENTPVFDILKYIAGSADKSGVIGFDFRVAPDGKFEFFPRNSKTSPVSLSEKIEVSEYRKDIHRIRNKITVYGAARRNEPANFDEWTDYSAPTSHNWSSDVGGTLSTDTNQKKAGSRSIKHTRPDAGVYNGFLFDIYAEKGFYIDCEKYKKFHVWVRCDQDCTGTVKGVWIRFIDNNSNTVSYKYHHAPNADEWLEIDIPVGPDADWPVGSIDWQKIAKVKFEFYHASATSNAWVDNMFFAERRWENTQEDSSSQSSYGLRELVEVDEELYSDAECQLRAKALLAHLKDPAEYLTVSSTVIDYGSNPLLAGDKITVVLPNENVNSDFRILSVEYFVDAKTQTLEITMKLGREMPLLADYLYALRSKTDHLSRHKIARLR